MRAPALDEVFSSLASVAPEQERERVFEEMILLIARIDHLSINDFTVSLIFSTEQIAVCLT